MWKEFTVQGNTQYFDILPQSLTKYSNTKHSSTEMMSEEANKKKNKGTVYLKMFGDMETATKVLSCLKIPLTSIRFDCFASCENIVPGF